MSCYCVQLQRKKKFLKKVATSLANVDVLFAFVDSVMITNGAFFANQYQGCQLFFQIEELLAFQFSPIMNLFKVLFILNKYIKASY